MVVALGVLLCKTPRFGLCGSFQTDHRCGYKLQDETGGANVDENCVTLCEKRSSVSRQFSAVNRFSAHFYCTRIFYRNVIPVKLIFCKNFIKCP